MSKLLFICLILPIMALAQNDIRVTGKVMDSLSKEELINVRISISKVDLKQDKTYKPPYTFIQPIDQITNVWSIKSDYTAKLKEGTFETGIQYRETAMDLDFVYSELKNTELVKNQNRSLVDSSNKCDIV